MTKFTEHQSRRSQRGSIFILALVVLFVLLLLGASLIESAQNAVSRAAVENRSAQAFHLAEAGVHKALHELGDPQRWLTYEGESDFDMGGGSVGVAVRPVASQRGVFTDHVTIIANGRIPAPGTGPDHSCTVRVIVHKDPRYFSYAVFGDDQVTIGNGTVNLKTDSYTSDEGTYGGVNIAANADIGTNSTAPCAVTIKPQAEVHGNVTVGAGAAIPESCVDNKGTITGSITALDAPSFLPSVTRVPTGAIELGDIWLEVNEELVLDAGTYHMTDLDVFGNGQITCNGKVVLYVDQSSDIATPDIRIGGNGIVNTSQIPSNLTIYCAPDVVSITISGSAAVYAGIYAPQADIVLNAGEIFGSVVGSSVTLNGANAHVHYDEALRDHASPYIAMGSWEVL
jgi:hypothetical protein